MYGIIYYILFMVIGVVCSDKLFQEKSTYFKLWSGGVIANVILMFGIVPFALLFDFTILAHILLAVFAIIPCFLIKRGLSLKAGWPDMWAFLWGGLICAVIIQLMENHILIPVKDGFASGQSTYGDTAMHIGFISSIAEQGKFPPAFNLLSGSRLCYPFLADSLSSSLYLLGTDLRTSIMLPSCVISVLTVMGFYYFAESITNKKSAVLAMLLFFFGGGFGFIYFLDGSFENPEVFTRIFTEYYKTPTNLVDENIRWVNPICDMIIPQRTTMAGWCVLLFAFWLLVEAIRTKKTKLFILLGFIGGSMPMIHTHSFLALVIVSAVCVFVFMKDSEDLKKHFTDWGIYAGIAFALSIGQLIYWTFSQSVGNSQFLRFGFNWVNEKDSYLWFWLKNWGITALFLIPAMIFKDKFGKKFSLGFWTIFILAEFVIFQPNAYDNNKLFFPVYMLFVCFVSEFLVFVYDKMKKIPGRSLLGVVVIFLGLFSGILTIFREYKSGGDFTIFSHSDMKFADFIKDNTEAESVFITGSDHLNPVSVLSGRTIYAGSQLYVYFHGYGDEMYKRYDRLKKIYESKSCDELKKNLSEIDHADYIQITHRERASYDINEEIFDSLPLVYDSDDIKLYTLAGME